MSNPKRDLILETGHRLFWKFGFRRVTVEEICREAGVSKMTFYKFFPNKTELVKVLMDGILQESIRKYRRIMESEKSYPAKVTDMIELKREQIRTMSSEFFRDYVQSADPEMIHYLNKLSRENMEMFLNDFRNAQQNGDIRKEVKIDFIMFMMNHMVEMTHDEQLLAMYENPEDLVMEITHFLFYGILSREKHA